ncbi:Enoyl-CoA hydratase/isomerase [Ruminiclostridium papyrosolvens DSM 2782]|uniref:Enoyl-CoA hydratase/isomerase n=1 Tax=Ruminiclostridium papyrosolvens DSM 2782 TaxID=588581 RepID=F1TD52_9FIRM|nr:enoyl-CoA hydratase/isomerase [Ruminiclostridium papyrosolvens]EGD47490.1 Enoyl-CoA hydratase/isomerase [Ruminiclostridium papyrosolvens DSM 2782]WES32394.1 enoyl-CoA hydratase/isomerase [Ruminiclostridium papyrosolvens DSM 2782]
MSYKTINVRFQDRMCFLQFYRPKANNTINDILIEECHQVLALCEESITVVILEGLPEVFCFGVDFEGIHAQIASGKPSEQSPGSLYDLWLKLATGPYITISHLRGKVNAGGLGFVAASDIVLADQTAQLSLSELLFGLFPACVLPFLIRRIGFQKANYLTLMTRPISVQQAFEMGLVDAYDFESEALLRKHLVCLRRLSKTAILRYKRYMNGLNDLLIQSKSPAVAANQEFFSDPCVLEGIFRFVEKGEFPWED